MAAVREAVAKLDLPQLPSLPQAVLAHVGPAKALGSRKDEDVRMEALDESTRLMTEIDAS